MESLAAHAGAQQTSPKKANTDEMSNVATLFRKIVGEIDC